MGTSAASRRPSFCRNVLQHVPKENGGFSRFPELSQMFRAARMQHATRFMFDLCIRTCSARCLGRGDTALCHRQRNRPTAATTPRRGALASEPVVGRAPARHSRLVAGAPRSARGCQPPIAPVSRHGRPDAGAGARSGWAAVALHAPVRTPVAALGPITPQPPRRGAGRFETRS
jgi:hypothetical protein